MSFVSGRARCRNEGALRPGHEVASALVTDSSHLWPTPCNRRRRCLFFSCKAAWLLLCMAVAIYSVRESLHLPDRFRGLTCCDSRSYLEMSTPDLSTIFYSSSGRAFGYPFLLGLLKRAFSDQLVATAVAQLLAHFLSSGFLFFCLRHIGVRISFFALGLLLAHPGLVPYAAISLTDSLATSCFSIFLGLSALVLDGRRFFILSSLLTGLVAGLMISLRNSLIMQLAFILPILLVAVVTQRRGASSSLRESVTRVSLFTGFAAIGFLPLYIHMCLNTYRITNEFALMSSEYATNATRSLHWGVIYSRVWGVVEHDGSWGWRSTEDRVLDARTCDISPSSPIQSLVSCFLSNPREVPIHLAHRIVGLFDNHHINWYAALATLPWRFETIRAFSVVGLCGLISVALLLLGATANGSLSRYAFLLFPCVFIAVQSIWHVEPRYVFPTVPILFLLGISAIQGNVFAKKWQTCLCIFLMAAVAFFFYKLTMAWDAFDLHVHRMR